MVRHGFQMDLRGVRRLAMSTIALVGLAAFALLGGIGLVYFLLLLG